MAFVVCSPTTRQFPLSTMDSSRTYPPLQDHPPSRESPNTAFVNDDQPLDFSKKSKITNGESVSPGTSSISSGTTTPERYQSTEDAIENRFSSAFASDSSTPLLPQLLTQPSKLVYERTFTVNGLKSSVPNVGDASSRTRDDRLPRSPPPLCSVTPARSAITSPDDRYKTHLPVVGMNGAVNTEYKSLAGNGPLPARLPSPQLAASEPTRTVYPPNRFQPLPPLNPTSGILDNGVPTLNHLGLLPDVYDKSRHAYSNGVLLRSALEQEVPIENGSEKKNSKTARPFKAYNPLPNPFPSGLPMLPIGLLKDYEDQESRYRQYVQQFYSSKTFDSKRPKTESMPQVNQGNVGETPRITESRRESPSTSGQTDSSPNLNSSHNTDSHDDSNSTDSQSSRQHAADTSSTSQTTRTSKRGNRSLPDEFKDAAYWERRRKNNEAAKRSRDSRRAKEDYIAMRARFLEDENKNLRLTVAFLRQELNTVKCCAAHSHNRF